MLAMQVPRPDGVEDDLGICLLDEPSALQSDPSIIQMRLRAAEPQQSNKVYEPATLPAAGSATRKLEAWIAQMRQLQQVGGLCGISWLQQSPLSLQ